ncbi:MAG TPA: VOC family protein [Frankiaceae bacterium]|nr:VOC family protein [Frankiaceae bacterium]
MSTSLHFRPTHPQHQAAGPDTAKHSGTTEDPHRSLHSDIGAHRREHPGRSKNPLVKVAGLTSLEFEKPDLDRAEKYFLDFGFVVADRTPEALWLRGRWASSPCLVVRRGPRSRFLGPTFTAAARDDLDRLARAFDTGVAGHAGGSAVQLTDPSGFPVRVVHGLPELSALPQRDPLPLNVGTEPVRANVPQRPSRRPAEIERIGHVVLGTTRFQHALDWYLDTFGLIVSDFLYLDGQRERGPSMAFIRCDLGSVPSDHHTLAMALQPETGYVHSAYQLTDLDEVAASGEFLKDRGHKHSWGIGRHIQGSQIFDYWRDPHGHMFEHYTDGDVFDSSVETGWAPMSASGLAQWGPKATRDFLGSGDPRIALAAIKSLAEAGNDINVSSLRGLIKAMSS